MSASAGAPLISRLLLPSPHEVLPSIMSFRALNLRSARFDGETEWPSTKKGAATLCTHYGERVLFRAFGKGGRHLETAELDKYRMVGDRDMDGLLQVFADEGRPIGPAGDLFDEGRRRRDTTDGSNSSSGSGADRTLTEFLQKHGTPPAWYDEDQVRRGQQVYLAFVPAISYSLFYRSLVPGFSIPKIAAVLKSTRYLAPPSGRDAVMKRLTDTGAFLAAVVCSDVSPGSSAWKTALQVRLLHAKVRRALLQRTGEGQWNVDELGVPINQEDMAATLLAFAVNSMLGCEIVAGFPISKQQRLDFSAFWRYIGWLLGVDCCEHGGPTASCSDGKLRPLDPCGPGWYPNNPDPLQHSYAVLQSILLHNLHPNELSVEISHHLLKLGQSPRGQDAMMKMNDEEWFYFRSLQCRRFVGDPLADALQLPFHPVWTKRIKIWMKSTLILWMLRLYTWAALRWSPLRKRIMRFHQSKMSAFVDHWRDELQKPSKATEKGDSGDDRTESSVHTKKSEGDSNTLTCPFAMVAPPDY